MSYRDFDGREVDGNGRAIAIPEPSRERGKYDRSHEPALCEHGDQICDACHLPGPTCPQCSGEGCDACHISAAWNQQRERILELETALTAIGVQLQRAHPYSRWGTKYCTCTLCRALKIIEHAMKETE